MPLHFLLPPLPDALVPGDRATEAQPGDAVVLTGTEAHHAAAVRRVRVGEEVTVGDGRGTWLTGQCEAVTPREVVVRVTARADTPAPHPRIVLAQALAKGDRDELAVQAATELGVDEIVPWQAARSVSRWDAAKAEKGRARWSTIVREAAKQAHRAWIPEVAPLATTASLAERAAASHRRRPRAFGVITPDRPRSGRRRLEGGRPRGRARGRHRAGRAHRPPAGRGVTGCDWATLSCARPRPGPPLWPSSARPCTAGERPPSVRPRR